MQLPFLNRNQETNRLKAMFGNGEGGFACIYGRRRCGKSRLLREVLPAKSAVYYVADQREAPLQIESLASEIGRVVQGFSEVQYPTWDALLQRWYQDAPRRAVLAIDEFPFLVQRSPELPSLLQKYIDQNSGNGKSVVLCGSSQMMMQGLVLDADAPLYGRATEILKVSPLKAGWVKKGLSMEEDMEALLAYSLWGGVPRYWELAAGRGKSWEAYTQLVLDPLGVLHTEPSRLLHDDLRDTAQSFSILSLVGQGCHRLSEIAGRLGKPSTSLTRPVKKLLDLGLIEKEVPFLADPKSNKRALYRISDPFLTTWYKHVLPNRSMLDRGMLQPAKESIIGNYKTTLAACWEKLAREAAPLLGIQGMVWTPASRWWGSSVEKQPMEIDLLAECMDGKYLMAGEAKLSVTSKEASGLLIDLEKKARLLPFANKYGGIVPMLFTAECKGKTTSGVLDAGQVLSVLK